MRNINFIIIIGTFSISALGFGQDTLTISKKYFVQKANDKNLQLQIANQVFKSAQADYRQSNALFLPSITASHTAISTTNPLMAFGTKLNQEVLSASDFNPALLNDLAVTQNYTTKIQVLQPLINMDGLYGRQAAKSKNRSLSIANGFTFGNFKD